MKRWLLITIALLAVAIVVLPNFKKARKNGKSSCLGQLRAISGAKDTWALENRKTTNDVPTDADLFGPDQALARKPVCPQGGVYRLGAVGERPQCSFPRHTNIW